MHMIRRGPWYGFALSTLTGFLLSGCGSELDEASPQIEHREGPALVCNQANGCCDRAIYDDCIVEMKSTANGYRVVVSTFICRATDQSVTPSSSCRVDPTDYSIGGGVVVLDTLGAAPTSSLPIAGLGGGWKATSAGISGPVTHRLQTYAIGLQVLDSSLRSVNIGNDIHRYAFSANTGDPNRLSGTLTVPAGDLLIGGGWSAGGGAFAVDSYATGMLGGKWHLNGRQFRAGTAQLSGVAIGLSRCLPAANPVFCFGTRGIIEVASPDTGGIVGAVANNTHSAQFVVGVGAMSSSWERPIWGLYSAGLGSFGTDSQYGAGVAFTVGPEGDSGHVTAQIMTVGP
jgi:hypothetical protein